MAKVLTPARRARLEKLAAYLEGLRKSYRHFNMEYWLRPKNAEAEAKYARENGGVQSCGTIACAVGHGPAAGVLVPEEYITPTSFGPFVNWSAYSEVFVERFTPEHDWCFSGSWQGIDGSHYGAAARIRYLLEKGAAPEGFDSRPSRKWRPLYAPYRVDAKAKADA